MHRRAARTLIAALTAACLIAPASAAAYTITAQPTPEGDGMEFTVTPEGLEGGAVTATPVGVTATAGEDFDATPKQNVVVAPGGTKVTVPTTADVLDEDDETLKLKVGDDESAPVAITDDDAAPALSVGDVSTPENGPPAKLAITAPNPSENAIVIALSTDGGAELSVPAEVTLAAGATSVDVPLTVANDTEDEPDETFAVRIQGTPAGATTPDPEGIVTIVNDDLRIVDIIDASTLEGDGGTSIAQFTVRLNGPTFRTVTVKFGTGDGTAKAPADYLSRLGTVTFTPGQTVTTFDVQVVGDDRKEDSEVFGIWLTEVTNARMGDPIGLGVIIDDDGDAPGGGGGGTSPGTGNGTGTGTGTGTSTGSGSGSGGEPDVTPPKVSLGAPRASGRRVTMRVSCPRGERTCAGRITLFTAADRTAKARSLRRERRVGAKSFRLRGGRSQTVAISVPASILRAARRSGRLKLQAFALTEDADENVDTRTLRATLRYRRPKG